MYADELDLPTLIRAKLYDLRLSVAETSYAIYGKRTALSPVLSGTRRITPKAFLSLVRMLNPDQHELKLWLAAYLVTSSIEFLPIVERAGLVSSGGNGKSQRQLAEMPVDIASEAWSTFGLQEGSCRTRVAICKALLDGPKDATELGRALGTRSSPVRSALRVLREKGLVGRCTEVRKVQGLYSEHNAKIVLWSLTDAGRAALEAVS